MHKLSLALIAILMPYVSIANPNKIYKNNLNTCAPTQEVMNNYEPKVFESSNNLLRKIGKEAIFCGEKVVLKGRLLDKNCVPISDAKVYLWQVGCDGKYPYPPLRTVASAHHINTESGSSFTGNGVTTTNNNGEFWFITILPAKSEHGGHHINLRVEHRDLGDLQTQVTPKIDTNGEYDFTIVMHQKDKYREY